MGELNLNLMINHCVGTSSGSEGDCLLAYISKDIILLRHHI